MSTSKDWIQIAEESELVSEILDCARLLYQEGFYFTAMRYIQKAEELNPKEFRKSTIGSTETEVQKMLKHRNIFQRVWGEYAKAEEARGRNDLDEAIRIIKEITVTAPNDPALLSSLGFYYWRKYEIEADKKNPSEEDSALLVQAEKHIAQALELDPYFAEAYNNMGLVHMYFRKPKEAMRFFVRALELKPDFPNAQRNLALLRRYAGDELDRNNGST